MKHLIQLQIIKINKIMTQQNSSKSLNHLENLFSQRSPKTKYQTESRIEEFNDSIAKQIINGDTVLNTNRDSSVGKPKNRYEQQLRRHKLTQAQQQKLQLQRKLEYVNRSIDSIKKYSFLKAQNQNQSFLSKSRQKSPQQIQALKKKDRQISQSIKKHHEKIQALKKEQEQRKRKQKQQQEKQRLEQQKQQKQRRKKQILKNMKKIKQQMQKRQRQNQKSTQKVKQIIHKKQLFHKFQQQYKEKQAITLQQRKKKLSEIRNFHKPIDINELKQHLKKFQQIRKQKEQLRLRQKKINSSSIHYKAPYIGSFYKEILQKKAENNDSLTQSKIKNDKIKQFAQHIRQNFVPQTSQRKKMQIQEFMEKQQERKRAMQKKLHEVIELRKQKGIQYTQQMRKLPKKRNNSSKIQNEGSKTARPVYKNYLSHSTSDSPNKTQQTWTKILTKKQLNKKQKARLLQYESQKMQQILRRQQKEGRLLKKDNQDEIDKEYYNMIKAKLNLLTSQG